MNGNLAAILVAILAPLFAASFLANAVLYRWVRDAERQATRDAENCRWWRTRYYRALLGGPRGK